MLGLDSISEGMCSSMGDVHHSFMRFRITVMALLCQHAWQALRRVAISCNNDIQVAMRPQDGLLCVPY